MIAKKSADIPEFGADAAGYGVHAGSGAQGDHRKDEGVLDHILTLFRRQHALDRQPGIEQHLVHEQPSPSLR